MNTRILLLVAIIMTAITGAMVYNQWAKPHVVTATAPATPPAPRRILIARHELIPGTFIHASQDLEWSAAPVSPEAQATPTAPNGQSLPTPVKPAPNKAAETGAQTAAAAPSYIYEGSASINDFNGSIVRRHLNADQPVLSNTLMKSDEGGFLSAVLAPGMCAVTIAVNATSGNGGFISPGDRIDLIDTHHVRSNGGAVPNQEQITSEIFIHNIRVVAVDQMLDNPDNKAILAKTVTVEVTPQQAEDIAMVSEKGKISVALLSLASAPAGAVAASTPASATTAPPASSEKQKTPYATNEAAASSQAGLPPHMQVIHGDQIQQVEFY